MSIANNKYNLNQEVYVVVFCHFSKCYVPTKTTVLNVTVNENSRFVYHLDGLSKVYNEYEVYTRFKDAIKEAEEQARSHYESNLEMIEKLSKKLKGEQ